MIATSENQTSGGSAAQTTNPNPNPNPQMSKQSHQTEPDEKPVQIKQAATKYECAASSLKYNIKAGKLPAYQKNATAPYLVRLSEVERFLRETPRVASMFHPMRKPPGVIKDGPSLTGLIDEPEDKNPPSPPDPSGESDGPVNPVKAENQALDQKHPAGNTDPSTQPTADGTTRKRRHRRRGRGKGRGGKPLAATELQPLVIKALTGTTPQERLRITACLNELAGLVASA